MASGEFEAAVVREEKIRGSLTNHFRILKTFPTTTMPWAARARLDPGIAGAFAATVVKIKDRKILENLPDDATEGFKPADLKYFEWLDQHMREIEEGFFGPGGIEKFLKENRP